MCGAKLSLEREGMLTTKFRSLGLFHPVLSRGVNLPISLFILLARTGKSHLIDGQGVTFNDSVLKF